LLNRTFIVGAGVALSLFAASAFAAPTYVVGSSAPVTHFVQVPPQTPSQTTNVAAQAGSDGIASQASLYQSQSGVAPTLAVGLPPSSEPVTANQFNQTITRLAQNQQMTQQLDMQQMHVLQQQNSSLQDQISTMTKAMTQMHQEVAAMGTQVVQLKQVANAPKAPPTITNAELMTSFVHSIYFKILSGLFAIALLSIIWFFARSAQKRRASDESDLSDTEMADAASDYDFLNSEDAIPAKLDLARAYMAMEDFQAANVVLNDVFVQGNSEHKQEAQALLDTIKQQTVSEV
jgi:FimV-like protein